VEDPGSVVIHWLCHRIAARPDRAPEGSITGFAVARLENGAFEQGLFAGKASHVLDSDARNFTKRLVC
jgi:hypothetical protein